jgi:TRAP-type C4-dicarboxylate transport system substrate-binding protein
LWKAGYKLFFASENGFRSMGSTFPIETLADLKGKKMRSQENTVHLECYKALGAAPVPIAVTEVLSALQTGVVDGFDNTPLFSFAASWHMGISHYSLTEHIYQPGIVVFSRKFWETLDPALQTAIVGTDPGEQRRDLAAKGRRGVRAIGPQLIENFKNSGIKVINPERSQFAIAAIKTHDSFAKRTTAEGKALLKAIKAALP